MPEFLIMFLLPLALIVIGLWQLTTPLDILWEKQERALLARGLSPQRNKVWERKTRQSGWICLVLGIVFLAIVGGTAASIPREMSGVTINGRELTQAEWEACGRSMSNCVAIEFSRNQQRQQ